MSTVVLSLFGDEIIPEQVNAVGKSRAARKPKSPQKEEIVLEEPEVVQKAVRAIEEGSYPVETITSVREAAELVQEVKQEVVLPVVEVAPVTDVIPAVAEALPAAVEIAPQIESGIVLPTVEVATVEDVIPVFGEAASTEKIAVPEIEQRVILPVVEIAPTGIEAVQSPIEANTELVEEVPQAVELPIVEIAPQAIEITPIVAEGPRTVETIPKAAVKKSKPAVKKNVAAKKDIVKREKPEGVAILEGWTPDKQYYSIGEVASLFYVATSHIRFWTNEFALKVRTTRKGDRLYSPEQINELRTIYHLVKEKGYTIAGAKARLKEAKKTPVHTLDLKQSLLQLRNKLVDIKNQL